MTDLNQHQAAVHELANKVDQFITDMNIRIRFADHIDQFCKMVEDYGQAQQPYSRKLEDAKNRIERSGNLKQFVGKSLTDICPPPKGYIKVNHLDNSFVTVPIGTIYRPAEPTNPLLWLGIFGNAGIQRKPTNNEKLMCDYVRLAVIHDYELRYSGTPTDIPIFSADYKGKWFQRNQFCEDVWAYYHYDNQSPDLLHYPATPQEKLSQLKRALEHVQADLASLKSAETEQNATPAKWSRVKTIICAISGVVIFLAALLTILYYLGWLEPIRTFIVKILWPK